MIKINLTPDEELENPLWWVPDVLLAVTISLCGFFGTQYYLSDSKDKIENLTREISSLEDGTKALQGDVKKYTELDNDIKALSNKLTSLGKLTASEVVRYKPVILLEHLQNLSPVGLWFQSIEFKEAAVAEVKRAPGAAAGAKDAGAGAKETGSSAFAETIDVKGTAFDNLLVAEFLAALRATQSQDIDPRDLRTHVYFSDIKLLTSRLQAGMNPLSNDTVFSFDPTLGASMMSNMLPEFELKLEVQEHKVAKAKGDLAQL